MDKSNSKKYLYILILTFFIVGGTAFFVASSPKPRFVGSSLDGTVIKKHPRILLPELRNWDGQGVADPIKKRLASFSNKNQLVQSHCDSKSMLFQVSCWLATNQTKTAEKLLNLMEQFDLQAPEADDQYSNVWKLALAYDLFYPYLAGKDDVRLRIEKKIFTGLEQVLRILDGESASLWHGRSSHAAIAWICAIVLPENLSQTRQLRKRAQGHFLEVIKALEHTEIWPEGYNYWIQNRAFPFALASAAYLNGLENAKNSTRIRELMRTVGYWHIYATRPDNRIEGFGDEGSRVDLKDETKRVIDLIATLTKDSVLAGYAKYLQHLHGSPSYYHGYLWGLLLFQNPEVKEVGDGSLASLAPFLKNARLFGKNTTNYAYFRSGWTKDDTFITFKAGHSFAHHGHYDAGHFTIFKGAPLAINSSVYNQYFSSNRLNYSIRTVAKNSLLVLRPNEKVRPNLFFLNNVADGGQRVIQPTGSSIISLDHWFENFNDGLHFEGAKLVNDSFRENEYYYLSADLTRAYNNTVFDDNDAGGKIEEVIRNLVYLPKDDQLVIFDHVVSTDPVSTKKWLLHTVTQPQIKGLTILKGTEKNGISESHEPLAIIHNDQSYLKITRILPVDAVIREVGGQDYRYYVETDGDDKTLDGENFAQGGASKPWFDNGMWRLEVQPSSPSFENDFLLVLSPSIGKVSNTFIKPVKTDSKNIVGLVVGKTLLFFVRSFDDTEVHFSVQHPVNKVIVFGVVGKKAVELRQGAKKWRNFSGDGVSDLPLGGILAGEVKMTIKL